MISFVRGRLVHRRPGGGRDAATHVVVDVDGVGYLVLVPTGVAGQLPAQGQEVVLHTSLQVREDAMDLYGFPNEPARELFELLLGASGVGPKLALAALSTHPPAALTRAIADGDMDALTTIPGIGKKSAQRLILELKEKLGGVADLDLADAGGSVAGDAAPARTEAHLALLELGYSSSEAKRALDALDGDDGEASDLLRAALRTLAGAGS